MILGVAIPRAHAVQATWTTVHVALAALRRGHRVRFVEPWDFEVDEGGHVVVRAAVFDPDEEVPVDADALVGRLHARVAPRRYLRVEGLDVLLLRLAPADADVLAFAAMARDRGVTVVNDPDGLLRVASKAWLATLPGVPTPPTIVTQSTEAARRFADKQRADIVVKPARGSGGEGVARIPWRAWDELEAAMARARGPGGAVVVQRAIGDDDAGETRVVWMDGEVLGGYRRRRAPGEFRHNLRQGGTPEATEVTAPERAAVAALGPHLAGAGIRIAGIDLIDARVVEVNALNPGGAFHADRLNGTDVAGAIVDRLAAPGRLQHLARDRWARPAS